MSTNYYASVNECGECGKPEHELHVGKSVLGWAFIFRGYREAFSESPFGAITSAEDWRRVLSEDSVEIKDECGRYVDQKKFWRMVQEKRDKRNYARMYPGKDTWVDGEGHPFSSEEML